MAPIIITLADDDVVLLPAGSGHPCDTWYLAVRRSFADL